MSQRPADKRLRSRDALWFAIREYKVVTAPGLSAATGMEISAVRDYLRGLAKAGYLERVSAALVGRDATITALWYRLARDCGTDAPRVRESGESVTQGRSRENMWRTMRILKMFSVAELAVTASLPDCRVDLLHK